MGGFIGKSYIMGYLRQLTAKGLNIFPECGIREDDDLGIRIIDDVLDLLGYQGGVDRNCDSS